MFSYIEESMVNKEFEKNIIDIIGCIDGFNVQDFIINSHTDKTEATVLTIVMNGTSYNFKAIIPNKRKKIKDEYARDGYEFSIRIECNPGEIVDNEIQDLNGRNELIGRIKTWLVCLKSNIDSTYTHRKIEHQRKMIEELTKEIKADSYFTFEEADVLKCKLEQQQQQIEDLLRQQTDESKDLEIKIKQLESEFEELKKMLLTHTKKGWLQSWLGRALKWGLDPNNQKAMIETTKNVKSLLE